MCNCISEIKDNNCLQKATNPLFAQCCLCIVKYYPDLEFVPCVNCNRQIEDYVLRYY